MILKAFLWGFFFSPLFLYAQEEQCICCLKENQQFDFWIGDWEVIANGKIAGYNHIEYDQDKCLIRETWKSANPKYSGSSINFFDKNLKQWRQIWIDNQGGKLELFGSLRNRQMILQSKTRIDHKSGKKIVDRIIWTHNTDNTVRQLWERSEDGGESWSLVFDGLYYRKG